MDEFKKTVERIFIIVTFILIIGGFFLVKPTITGYVIYSPEGTYIDTLNINIGQNTSYLWIPDNPGNIESIKLSGSLEGDGALVYIKNNNELYLIYNGSLDNTEIINASNDDIDIIFKYNGNSDYDPNNNGIEALDGVIDFKINSEFHFEDVNYSKLCTKYIIENLIDDIDKTICYGSLECCSFIGKGSLSENWNNTLLLNYGKHMASYNNTINAQVIYYDVSLIEEDIHANIYNSEIAPLNAIFREPVEFNNICTDTCSLTDFDNDEYELIIKIDTGSIQIENISYTISEGRMEASSEENLTCGEETYNSENESCLTVNFPGIELSKLKVKVDDNISGSATGGDVESKNNPQDSYSFIVLKDVYDLRLKDGSEIKIIDKVDCTGDICLVECDTTDNTIGICEFISCTENWVQINESCSINDLFVTWYNDTNKCGTTNSLPIDNGTYLDCDYCTPNWIEINTSCQLGDTKVGWHNDLNSCFNTTVLESDNNAPSNKTYQCDYIISNKFNGTNFSNLDLSRIINPWLEIPAYGKINFIGNISINESLDLDSNIEIKNNSIFVNTTALPEFNKSAILTLYNTTFINPIILKNNQTCEECHVINNSNKTLVFNVSHFTTYSIIEGPYCGDGSCNNQESCSSCSNDCGSCTTTGGGGGSSSTKTITIVKKDIEEEINGMVDKEEDAGVEVYESPLEIKLPNEVSFVENDHVSGEIINKGDSDIERLNLDLSPELEEIMSISDANFENIKPGDKISFSLVEKIKDKKENFLTGAVTTISKEKAKIKGDIIFEGTIKSKHIIKNNIPLNIEFLKEERIFNEEGAGLVSLVLLLTIILFILLIKKEREIKERRRKERKRKEKRKNKS